MSDPQAWGIDPGYHDAGGTWRATSAETSEWVLATMGASGAGPKEVAVIVVAPGRAPRQLGEGSVHLEQGGEVEVTDLLPADLPLGYHEFEPATGGPRRRVVVSPGRCFLPAGMRTWGWVAQLYAVRSRASWGFGDLADLRHLSGWAASQGAGMVMINPLHATLPTPRQQASPYFASSRCFRNPLYLRVEDLPGADRFERLPDLARAGRALNTGRLIDRDAVWRLKSAAFEHLFSSFESESGAQGRAGFERYRAERGELLDRYAAFCALGERDGFDWRAWPSATRRPDGAGVGAFVASAVGARRVRFHAWLQWQLDEQLRRVAQPPSTVHDLAIGVDAGGADTWMWQDAYALGARVGAPPDDFNTQGQDWGLPPFDPWRLRDAGYEPFIQVVRAGLRHAAGIRIDHVMGLYRLFWIPDGAPPTAGAYVRYPDGDLLDILALESQRAGAYVIGEDLGTVQDEVRHDLWERSVLSYRLLWFEPSAPDSGEWPCQALAAVSTHDLPTVAGLWSGRDLATQRELGLHPNEEGTRAMRDRLAAWTGVEAGASPAQVVEAAYRLLARAPSAIVAATLDDAVEVEERPNFPSTTDEWPNWSLALPIGLEDIERAPLAAVIGDALRAGRPAPPGRPAPAAGAVFRMAAP